MKMLIDKLFCMHNWTMLDKFQVSSDIGDEYVLVLLSCTKCGKIKKIKME